MNLKDLFGGLEDNNKSISAPKLNIMLILIIVFVLLCIIGYFIYKANKFVGTGGILITAGPYNYHVFTKNNSIIFNTTGQVEYLIIGGGGSGGNNHGGGGGAGRVISGTIDVIGKSYPIVVGNGGIQPIMNSTTDCKGQDSSVFDIIAEGGGYGGGAGSGPASSGGSGGGGSGYNRGDARNGPAGGGSGYNNSNDKEDPIMSIFGVNDKAVINAAIANDKAVINAAIANSSIGLGNKGGEGNQDVIAGGGGGGGGSNSSGENGLSNKGDLTAQGGKGGSGTNKYSEWLTVIKDNMPQTWKNAIGIGYIAAGGGGGSWATEIQLGGNGGGGNGGSWQGNGNNVQLNIDPTRGVQNTGSGGGGGGSNDRLGAPGGSGLVIIRYKN